MKGHAKNGRLTATMSNQEDVILTLQLELHTLIRMLVDKGVIDHNELYTAKQRMRAELDQLSAAARDAE